MADNHIIAYFFSGFFAVGPIYFVVGVYLAIKRAMWSCSSD